MDRVTKGLAKLFPIPQMRIELGLPGWGCSWPR